MHWLLLLALLTSSTSLKSGGSASSLNRLAENSLRQQLGAVRSVNVRVAPGTASGDFDSFDVSLDGFSADRLMNAADRSRTGYSREDDEVDASDNRAGGFPDDESGYEPFGGWQPRRNAFNANEAGDILADILGGALGKKASGGRIGRVRLRATNFTFQGARYNALSADLGEIRFDWSKALRGDFDIRSIAPGTLALSLRGDQAARLLSPRLPSLRDVRVRFSGGRAFVGARSDFYGVNVPFEVGARLSVQQNRVMANDFSASVARLRLPSFVLDELTRGVNPLYDFDPQQRWPLAVNLATAQATGDVLAMRGGMQWLGFRNAERRRGKESRRDNDTQSRRTEKDFPDNRNRDMEAILGDIFGH